MPYKDPEKQREAPARYNRENREKLRTSQRSKRSKLRRAIQEIKESTPCADCELSYPHYVMDFDHLPGELKRFNISSDLSNIGSLKLLLEEIAKCEVVCANCHRHRTFMRKTNG